VDRAKEGLPSLKLPQLSSRAILSYLSRLLLHIGAAIPIAPSQKIDDRIVMRSPMGMYEDRSNLDVISVLMLLGEATIWKVVWSRFRSRRTHWKQWLFPISPGWTPLAGSLFAAMNRSAGPPNLIFDRPPEGAIIDGLILMNLDSGAIMLQRSSCKTFGRSGAKVLAKSVVCSPPAKNTALHERLEWWTSISLH
jgi:hypothetical protein